MPNKNGLILSSPTSTAVTGTGASATISSKGSVEFSSCASLSLNGVFSADYDNYMIVVRHVHSAGGPYLNMRLRASGTDATASNYAIQKVEVDGTSVTSARYTASTSFIEMSITSDVNRSGQVYFMYAPFLSQPTAVRGIGANGNGGVYLHDGVGTHSLSTSYDGFTLTVSSGSISGRIAVYGMRN